MPSRAHGRLSALPARPDATLPAGTYALGGRGPRSSLLVVPDLGARAGEPAPLLVFCHGAGGTPEGARALIEDAAAEAGVLLLLPASAGATWDVILSGGPGADTATLDSALQQVAARCAVGDVAIGGFSDGGSYALSIGLANGELFGAVLAFSPGFVSAPRLSGRPRVFISHGTADAVLPVQRCGRRIAGRLDEQGYPVTYQEFDGGHVVPAATSRRALEWWLAGGR